MKLTILSILLECEHSRIMQKFCWNEFTFIRKMHQTRNFFAFQKEALVWKYRYRLHQPKTNHDYKTQDVIRVVQFIDNFIISELVTVSFFLLDSSRKLCPVPLYGC